MVKSAAEAVLIEISLGQIEVVASLREAIDGFFARVAEPPTDEGLTPLLRKLAGARGLRKGATSDEIQALESRLGVKLPPSYTRFLGITNGLRKGKNSLAFLPTSKIAWFRDVDRAWIAAYRDEGADVPHLEDALRIAGPHDGEIYLLNPRVKMKSGEWEAWRFSNHLPGETRYASLRALLESLADGD